MIFWVLETLLLMKLFTLKKALLILQISSSINLSQFPFRIRKTFLLDCPQRPADCAQIRNKAKSFEIHVYIYIHVVSLFSFQHSSWNSRFGLPKCRPGLLRRLLLVSTKLGKPSILQFKRASWETGTVGLQIAPGNLNSL